MEKYNLLKIELSKTKFIKETSHMSNVLGGHLALVQKWLREIHQVVVECYFDHYTGLYDWSYWYLDTSGHYKEIYRRPPYNLQYDTYEESLTVALLTALPRVLN